MRPDLKSGGGLAVASSSQALAGGTRFASCSRKPRRPAGRTSVGMEHKKRAAPGYRRAPRAGSAGCCIRCLHVGFECAVGFRGEVLTVGRLDGLADPPRTPAGAGAGLRFGVGLALAGKSFLCLRTRNGGERCGNGDGADQRLHGSSPSASTCLIANRCHPNSVCDQTVKLAKGAFFTRRNVICDHVFACAPGAKRWVDGRLAAYGYTRSIERNVVCSGATAGDRGWLAKPRVAARRGAARSCSASVRHGWRDSDRSPEGRDYRLGSRGRGPQVSPIPDNHARALIGWPSIGSFVIAAAALPQQQSFIVPSLLMGGGNVREVSRVGYPPKSDPAPHRGGVVPHRFHFFGKASYATGGRRGARFERVRVGVGGGLP